jgi:hypothetical protein
VSVCRKKDEKMKSRTLKVVGVTAVAVLAFYFTWPRVYSVLFPQEVLVRQTLMRLGFLAAAASEAQRFQGAWPASIEQLVARPDPSGSMAMFLKGGTNDAWGHPIVFEPFDSKRGYGRIISYGADGKPGGVGSSADIVLHYGYDQKMTVLKRE